MKNLIRKQGNNSIAPLYPQISSIRKTIPPIFLFTLIVTTLIITAIFPETQAATTAGTLTQDETWTGTLTITGDVSVPSGRTLTIEPGTTI